MVLVILTDFTEAATNAAHYAIGLSGQLRATTLILYHSIETAHMATELPLPSEAERRHLFEAGTQKLAVLRSELQSLLPEGTRVEILTDERPLEFSAQAVADETHADLLILGTTRRKGIQKVLYESTASMLSTACRTPLLIVPEHSRYEPIRNITLTSDLKQVAARTPAEKIRFFMKMLQARLFILNVFMEDDGIEPDRLMTEQKALHDLLDEEKPETHFIGSEHIVEGIVQFIRDHGIHLVITVPRKHSFLNGIFHPSITKSLASRSNIPLLLLQPET